MGEEGRGGERRGEDRGRLGEKEIRGEVLWLEGRSGWGEREWEEEEKGREKSREGEESKEGKRGLREDQGEQSVGR